MEDTTVAILAHVSEKKPWVAGAWTFSVDEVANGVWEAVADDHQGGVIRHAGYTPEALLARVKREAAELTERRRHAATPKPPA